MLPASSDHHGTLLGVRTLLTTCRVPMVLITGSDQDFQFPGGFLPELAKRLTSAPEPWKLEARDLDLLSGSLPFDGYKILVEWADAWVKDRLSRCYGRPQHDPLWPAVILEPILRGALISALLMAHLPNPSFSSTLEDRVRRLPPGSIPDDLRKRLAAAAAANDLRSLILMLSWPLLHESGHEVLRRLGISPPSAPLEVTETWVLQHQTGDRVNQWWQYECSRGTGLFVIFYTKRCPYAQCLGCNLFTLGSLSAVSPGRVFEQARQLFETSLSLDEKYAIREVILGNNASILDPRLMPTSTLLYAATLAAETLPNLQQLVLETRSEFVQEEPLTLVRETLDSVRPGIGLEVAIGIELFDEHLRNERYKKGLTNEMIQHVMRVLSQVGASLRCYFMYRPLPEMTIPQAQQDIRLGVAFLDRLQQETGVPVTMHLNPTFVAQGSPLGEAWLQGAYQPVELDEVITLLQSLPAHQVRIHVGLSDEGLAIPGSSFLHPGCEDALERLRRFNSTQSLD